MRERRAARVAALEILLAQVHAVGQHRPSAGEAVMGVDVEIITPLWKQPPHPVNLVATFSDMGLHEHVGVLAPKAAGELQLLRRAGGGKSRGDGIETAPATVPLRD